MAFDFFSGLQQLSGWHQQIKDEDSQTRRNRSLRVCLQTQVSTAFFSI